jgi:UDP-3-O-[3-hydroxymyristoyl] glucosamine N-acyltransferase
MIALSELVSRFGGEIRGDAAGTSIGAVNTLLRAGPTDIAFYADRRYAGDLAATRAGAVILTPHDAGAFTGRAWLHANPHLCFAHVAALLHTSPVIAGIHATASVADSANISASAQIGALAIIEPGAEIGPGCVIGAGAYVGSNARIGAGTILHPRASVMHDCVIGERCVLHPGAVVGSDGFGFARDGAAWIRVPQLGRVLLGDDVEIGANTTVDRGALDDTVIARGVKLDNLIQIAHNVRIGEQTAIAAMVGVSGSTTIGARCTFGGQAGVAGHLHIADDVHVTGTSLVSGDIRQAGDYSSAISAGEAAAWRRNAARLRNLDELAARLKKLETGTQIDDCTNDGNERSKPQRKL